MSLTGMDYRRHGAGFLAKAWLPGAAMLTIAAILPPQPGNAQSVIATVPTGTDPFAVAVNPATNKVYVSNRNGGTVTVIDGATNSTTSVAAGLNPTEIAVNSITNKIYVANEGDPLSQTPGSVTIIDGATNSTISVATGIDTRSPAVNQVTNKIYAANYFISNNVSVIDGGTNTVTATVAVGSGPTSVAVNQVTNKIYVANVNSSNVTVIDGGTNATSTVNVGSGPTAVAVNPVTNKIYVAYSSGNTVTVIDGATNSTTTVTVGSDPVSLAVNTVTNKIYVANSFTHNVTVIDGATNSTTTVAAGWQPQSVAVNSITNKIYVANIVATSSSSAIGSVTVIDGATNSTTTVTVGNSPRSVAVNAVTNRIYTANGASNNVTVIDANTMPLALISSQSLGALRNNYSGFVGFEFTVGSSPVTVYSLGRFIAPGNTGTHLVKLVQANGVDVPNGSSAVSTSGASAGTFQYAPLPGAVTLLANTSYFLVSQEFAGGDLWYDYGPVAARPAVTVLGPAYTDSANHYVAVTVLPGQSYVPVSFLYAPPISSLGVSILSPPPGSALSSTAAPVTVSTIGPVTSLQLQVDGINQGGPVAVSPNQGPVYTLNLGTTALLDGQHSLSVIASDAQGDAVVSVPIAVNINNSGGIQGFVVGETLGPLRNNYTGWVGLNLTVGSAPLMVTALERFVAPGNSGVHVLKLVNSNGTDVPGGSVSVSLAGGTPGQFRDGVLTAPVTLQPGTTYYLVSQETAGGDQWYDHGPVTTTEVGAVIGPVYTDSQNHYITVSGFAGQSYVPVSLRYSTNVGSLSVAITSPENGNSISGNDVPVTVATTGNVTSLQLRVNGVPTGPTVPIGPLTFNTTSLQNGPYTLTVAASDGVNTVVSSGVNVAVNNPVGATPFLTSQVPSRLRNDYSGSVGMAINVGATSLTVTSLGRMFVAGNSRAHILRLVQFDGTPVPGGSVTLSLAGGGTPGQYSYAPLATTVTLAAGNTYFLVSEEVAGGDLWYDYERVTTTGVGTVAGPTYTDGQGRYVLVPGFSGYSYVPVNFLYQ